MTADQEGYENPVTSLLSSASSSEGTLRTVFELTMGKLRSLNNPTGRDSSLRKSVLIFNLLRCFQRNDPGNVVYDVEMIPSGSVDDANEDNMGEEVETQCDEGDSSDAETRLAVIALSTMDHEESNDSGRASYQISSSNTTPWNLTFCDPPEELEVMDVDQISDTWSLGSSPVSNNEDVDSHDGLIIESHRLVENGGYVISNEYTPIDHRRLSYYPTGASQIGEYELFSNGNGFSLFA